MGMVDGPSGPHHRPSISSSFIHNSFHSSTDFPTYITWHTLSTDVTEKIKHGSVRLSRANTLEYATITEEGEKSPLINGARRHRSSSVVTPATRSGISWSVAAFLLVNSALGAGVLNYPAAYERAGGVAITTVMQIVLMLLLMSTMIVLAYCSDLNEDNTYHDVLLSTCGKRAQQMAAVSILLSCFGICITFLIIIGDQYDRLLASVSGPTFCHTWYMSRQFTITATAIVFIWPLCYFQRLDFLKYASTLGIFAMLYPVFLTIYMYFTMDRSDVELKTAPNSVVDIFVITPVICFAYQTHEVVLPIYSNMTSRNVRELTKAAICCMLFLFFVYTLAGMFGYLTFGSKVMPDIMQMFDASSPLVLIGIGALIVKMCTTYPLLLICGRGAFDGLYAELFHVSTDVFIQGERARRVSITTVWFVTTVLLAIFTPDIGIVIELLGCLACANIFIFPGLCLLGLVHQEDKFNVRHPNFLFFIGGVMIVVGAYLFGVVLIQAILVDIQSGGGNHELLCK